MLRRCEKGACNAPPHASLCDPLEYSFPNTGDALLKPGSSNDCVLVDLDGTLADCGHRLHFIEKTPKNWKGFLDPFLVAEDPLIEPVARVVRSLGETYPIIYVSGRTIDLYDTTKTWLTKHGFWTHPFLLFMRPARDFRSDVIVKRELLKKIRKEWNPWLAIDDRSSVVQMWRDEGLTCFQVSDETD